MERPRHRQRVAATAAAIAALVVAVVGVAAGQAQTQPQMQIQPTSGLPGSAATVSSITPCTGAITIADGPPTGSFATLGTTTSTGSWSVPITIPPSAATGPFTVHGWCDTPNPNGGSSSSSSSSLVIASTGAGGPGGTATPTTRTPAAVVPTVRTVYAPVTFTVTSSTTTSTTKPSGPPTMQLSSSTVVQGGKVVVTTQGWQPGSTVQVWLRSEPVFAGSAIADQAGSAVVEISVPPDFPPGAHQVVMTGISLGGVAAEVAADLTVTSLGGAAAAAFGSSGLGAAAASSSGGTTATGSSGTLPSTGPSRVVGLTALALGLIVVGSALVAVRRRSV